MAFTWRLPFRWRLAAYRLSKTPAFTKEQVDAILAASRDFPLFTGRGDVYHTPRNADD